MPEFKRINIKGRYYIIAKVKGKIRSRRLWKKDFQLSHAKAKFSKDKHFKKGYKRLSLKSNTIEFSRHIEDVRRVPSKDFGVRAKIVIDGNVIYANSTFTNWASVDDAKADALNNLHMRVAESINANYDDTESAEQLIKIMNKRPSFKVIQYKGV